MKKFLLKRKVALVMVVGTLLSIISVGFISNYYITDFLVENKKERAFYTSVEQSHESAEIFRSSALFLHTVRETLPIAEYLTTKDPLLNESIYEKLEHLVEDEFNYLSIYILDRNGTTQLSTDEAFLYENYSFRSYYQKSIMGEASIDFAVGTTSGKLGYYFSEPVFDNNKSIVGVIVLMVDPNEINSGLSNNLLEHNSTLMITSDKGVILASTDDTRLLKSLGKLTEQQLYDLALEKKYANNYMGYLAYDDIQREILNYKKDAILQFYNEEDRGKDLMSVLKIGNSNFFLVTETHLETVHIEIANIIFVNIATLASIMIICSIIVYLLLVKFLSPISEIINFFNQMSKGSFGNKILINSNDEFSDIADSINKMSVEINELYNNLDQKVKEQTGQIKNQLSQLEIKNSEALEALIKLQLEKNKAEILVKELEKFKLAVDNASDQIVITDPEGIVLYGNLAMEKITGYTRKEVLGKKAGTLWKVPMTQEYYKKLWNTIKIDKKTFISEIKNMRKNGEIYDALISISSVKNINDEILFFVALERDITEEKEIDRAKTEFVSLASHQLRTPLAAIGWYTEMLLSQDVGEINDNQKSYLEEIENGNKRITELVQGLLDVSKIDMGVFNLDIEKINVHTIITILLKELEQDILSKNITIDSRISEEFTEFRADSRFLRIIFQNLITNAIKYTKDNTNIKLDLFQLEKGNQFGGKIFGYDTLAFSVQDFGMGIPENQQDKIFEKLFRADNAKKSVAEGTGLGLYLIKSIVDKSSGEVWFSSKEGEGTIFYITFPVSGMAITKEIQN